MVPSTAFRNITWQGLILDSTKNKAYLIYKVLYVLFMTINVMSVRDLVSNFKELYKINVNFVTHFI